MECDESDFLNNEDLLDNFSLTKRLHDSYRLDHKHFKSYSGNNRQLLAVLAFFSEKIQTLQDAIGKNNTDLILTIFKEINQYLDFISYPQVSLLLEKENFFQILYQELTKVPKDQVCVILESLYKVLKNGDHNIVKYFLTLNILPFVLENINNMIFLSQSMLILSTLIPFLSDFSFLNVFDFKLLCQHSLDSSYQMEPLLELIFNISKYAHQFPPPETLCHLFVIILSQPCIDFKFIKSICYIIISILTQNNSYLGHFLNANIFSFLSAQFIIHGKDIPWKVTSLILISFSFALRSASSFPAPDEIRIKLFENFNPFSLYVKGNITTSFDNRSLSTFFYLCRVFINLFGIPSPNPSSVLQEPEKLYLTSGEKPSAKQTTVRVNLSKNSVSEVTTDFYIYKNVVLYAVNRFELGAFGVRHEILIFLEKVLEIDREAGEYLSRTFIRNLVSYIDAEMDGNDKNLSVGLKVLILLIPLFRRTPNIITYEDICKIMESSRNCQSNKVISLRKILMEKYQENFPQPDPQFIEN